MKMPFAHFVIKFMHFESHDFHVLLSLLRSIAVIYRWMHVCEICYFSIQINHQNTTYIAL